ncbi:A-kinase anchor protein 2-like [Protopterus annectens]|uniref:A-kinase anchor protein 2-like n=1 Tax=Protopterus annectens TaxID=7888 RepID=UPI001CFC2F44|nr:A-kinase anchor protein 2-like [Protopterus annectens]
MDTKTAAGAGSLSCHLEENKEQRRNCQSHLSEHPPETKQLSKEEVSCKSQQLMDKARAPVLTPLQHSLTKKGVLADGSHYLYEYSYSQQNKSGIEPYAFGNYSIENGFHTPSSHVIKVVKSGPSVSITDPSRDRERDSIVHASKVLVEKEQTSSFLEDPGQDIWVLSPEREARLTILRQEPSYSLRAYHDEKKPMKLFQEDDKEKIYKFVRVEVSPEKVKELQGERNDVVRNQALKKSSTVAEKWGSLDRLDFVDSGSPRTEDRYYSRFSPSYDTGSLPSLVSYNETPDSVDKESINFAAARQQFLQMEKSNKIPYFPSQISSDKSLKSPEFQYDQESPSFPRKFTSVKAIKVNYIPDAEEEVLQSDYTDSLVINKTREFPEDKTYATNIDYQYGRRAFSNLKQNQYLSASAEDLDSGLGEFCYDVNAGYVSDGSISNEVFVTSDINSSEDYSTPPPETPIEKEIRLVLEREKNLRKERGIATPVNTDVMVEIQTKSLFSQPATHNEKWKSRRKIGSFIQKEIEREVKREEDLKQEGKVMGMYDRGIQQELEDRKKVFQQDDEIPVMPHRKHKPKNYSTEIRETRESKASESSSPPKKDSINHEDRELQLSVNAERAQHRHSKYMDREVISPLPLNSYYAHPYNDRENQTVQAAVERLQCEQTEPYDVSYSQKTLKDRTLYIIEKEIEDTVRRENELRQQRRSLLMSDCHSSSSPLQSPVFTGETVYPAWSSLSNISQHSSKSASTATTPAAHGCRVEMVSSSTDRIHSPESTTWVDSPYQQFSSTQTHKQKSMIPSTTEVDKGNPRGLTDTLLQDFEIRKVKLKREEATYAGIEPTDNVNNELVEATRVMRHKNAMAMRWEAGIFQNEADGSALLKSSQK